MREIKFRVWNGSKMEYNIMAGFLGAFYVQGMDEKDAASMSPFNTKYFPQTPVMQYTGLKDKNGKEIYEGDVLNVHIFTEGLGERLGVTAEEHEFKAEIVFGEMGLWLQANNENDCGYILWLPGMHEESLEAIGNTHENPELLNGN